MAENNNAAGAADAGADAEAFLSRSHVQRHAMLMPCALSNISRKLYIREHITILSEHPSVRSTSLSISIYAPDSTTQHQIHAMKTCVMPNYFSKSVTE